MIIKQQGVFLFIFHSHVDLCEIYEALTFFVRQTSVAKAIQTGNEDWEEVVCEVPCIG